MSYITPDYTSIKTAILRDISNQLPGAAIGSDSDYAVRASGEAAAIEGLYQHQQWLYRQIFPDTADSANLEYHARVQGLTRKAAAQASGSATFTGLAGSPIPQGTAAQTTAGIALVTIAAASIDGTGSAIVAISASIVGISGNLPVNTALALTTAPTGINTALLISTATTGGAEIEADSGLLARLLFLLQSPPQGGSASDYKDWALAVSGVGYAYIYGQRRAINSVDIVILDSLGALPTTQLITAAQAAIDLARPVTADCLVLAPTAVPVAITATLTVSGVTTVQVAPAITAALQAYFNSLKPGDTVIKNKLINLILATSGVVDVALSAPATNVVTLVDSVNVQIPALGTVTLS